MSRNQRPDIDPGTGPWFLQLSGVPREFTWQDLKDEVRTVASHVGQVDVRPNSLATIALRKWEEASGCYRLFATRGINQRPLYVELWETAQDGPARLITRNMPGPPAQAAFPARAAMVRAPPSPPDTIASSPDVLARQVAQMALYPRQKAMPATRMQPMYQSYSMGQSGIQATAGAVPYQVAAPYQVIPAVGSSYSMAYQAPPLQAPYYATGQSGMPTNVKRGTVRTEFRGVFVSNLSYDTDSKDLQRIFGNYGEIVKMDHKKEERTNSKGKTVYRSKGSAIITFASSDQAKKAVQNLNGSSINDRQWVVRFDTEATPVDPPQTQPTPVSTTRKNRKTNNSGAPLIVDSSKYSR